MPTVLLMRCGSWLRKSRNDLWQRDAPLTAPGILAIRSMARIYLARRTIHIASSSLLRRGRETLAAALPSFAAREMSPGLTPGAFSPRLRAVFSRPFDLASTTAEHEGGERQLRNEAARVTGVILGIAGRLPIDGTALLVSHAPLCDLAVALLTDQWPPRQILPHGSIVELRFHPAGYLRSVLRLA